MSSEATVTHDDIPPELVFQAPPALAHVRGFVPLQADASDSGSALASLTITMDGQTLTATVTPALPAPAATATAGKGDAYRITHLTAAQPAAACAPAATE